MNRPFLPLVILTILLLVSCAQPVLPEPRPTPEIVTVALDSSIWPLHRALRICSEAHPDLVVSLQEISPAYQDWTAFDLVFRLGEPEDLPPFAAPLGVEELAVVVNTSNPSRVLSDEELEGIFSGRYSRWSDVGGPFRPIQVWVYPDGETMNQSIDETFIPDRAFTSHALLAPNAAAMLEAISGDPNSIGFLPHAWLDDSVHVIEVDPETRQKLQLPLLALAVSEPAGAAGRLLYCLQQGDGSEEIFRLYES